MTCRFLVAPHGEHGAFYRATQGLFEALDARYRASLDAFLRRRRLVLPLLAGAIALTGARAAARPIWASPAGRARDGSLHGRVRVPRPTAGSASATS
jgi:multidrug efflux pump subunit AcrB